MPRTFRKALASVAVLAILIGIVNSLLKSTKLIGTRKPAKYRSQVERRIGEYGFVKAIVDGDTVQLSSGQIVRYIGIDAPEQDQPFYLEAKRANERLVLKKRVRLEFDVQRQDRYGRWLAYVFVKKGGREVFVNAELVRNGYAMAYTVPPNVKYSDLFVRLQREAVENERGLWKGQQEGVARYIGNRRTLTFHRPTCLYAKSIAASNRIIFRSRKSALKAGYRPCRACRP